MRLKYYTPNHSLLFPLSKHYYYYNFPSFWFRIVSKFQQQSPQNTHTHTQGKMNCCALFLNSTIFPITINIKSVTFKNQSFFLRQSSVVSANLSTITKHKSLSSVHSNSLRVLEWDKLCDSVSSFATTSFGREATKVSLSLSLSLSLSNSASNSQ